MRALLYLAFSTLVVGCTRQIDVKKVVLGYEDKRLVTLRIFGSERSLERIQSEAAMYVALFPCASKKDEDRRYFPVGDAIDQVPHSRYFTINVSTSAPQQSEQPDCAQVLADGMSFTRYRSMIVPAVKK